MRGRTSLNLENVLLTVSDPPPCVLKGEEELEITLRNEALTKSRDWRELRKRLLNIDYLESKILPAEIASWLNDAGYVAGHSDTQSVFFTAENVSRPVIDWIFHWTVVVGWGMSTFDPSAGPQQVQRFREYWEREKAGQRAITEMLFEDVGGAPDYLPLEVWKTFMDRMGTSRDLLAMMRVDSKGRPIVSVAANSPMHAITLTVFIDRVFTKRSFGVCKWCSCKFIKRTRWQLFCPRTSGTSHQSLWKTRFRRDKIRVVKEASYALKRRADWPKIARRAERLLKQRYPGEGSRLLAISAKWAKQELQKLQRKADFNKRTSTRRRHQ